MLKYNNETGFKMRISELAEMIGKTTEETMNLLDNSHALEIDLNENTMVLR
jgi:hypothetical protein